MEIEILSDDEDSAPPTSTDTTTTTTTPIPTPNPKRPTDFVPKRPFSKENGPPIDLSGGDGGVIKRVKREGTGASPKKGDLLTVHYVAMYGDDGVLFDSSRTKMNRGGHSYTVGSNEQLKEGIPRPKGWDVALMQMKMGECALLTLQPEYAFGRLGVRNPPRPGYTVPPNVVVMYNIEIVEIGTAKENMTKNEKMNKGQEFATKGNDHFRGKEYEKAIAQYELALDILQTYPDVRHDLVKNPSMEIGVVQARREIVRCLSNVATCHSKWTKTPVKKDGLGVSNWKEVMKNCDQAVWVHDGGKVNDDRLLSKILYRRAEVWLHKSETTKARADLERAFVCCPESKSINKLLKETLRRQKSEKQQRVEMFGGMLNKSSEENETPSLYEDKKDVDLLKMKKEEEEHVERERARKESSEMGGREGETIMRMLKENYMFILSVVLLSLALVMKAVFLS